MSATGRRLPARLRVFAASGERRLEHLAVLKDPARIAAPKVFAAQLPSTACLGSPSRGLFGIEGVSSC